ncbi:hypothetical protein AGR6A_pTi0016 [Agrobacterium sp. NCPPB 925]|nr:hypothetical protein AGR6A_pTi0016 [Agrobacterium sp. NCPPB 925]
MKLRKQLYVTICVSGYAINLRLLSHCDGEEQYKTIINEYCTRWLVFKIKSNKIIDVDFTKF